MLWFEDEGGAVVSVVVLISCSVFLCKSVMFQALMVPIKKNTTIPIIQGLGATPLGTPDHKHDHTPH